MKQKIRVVGIIRRGDDILLLKRTQVRVEAGPSWELPTGKINFGEQPEEAMTRAIDENLGVSASKVHLRDAITFVALSESSRLYNLYIVYDVEISEDAKITPTERYSQYKFVKVGSDVMNGMKINDATMSVLSIELSMGVSKSEVSKDIESTSGETYRNVANGATIYVDGASKGNPGPAGIGYHIVDQEGNVLKSGGEFIGFATSRVAEYYALKEGCEQAIDLGLKSVRFVSDNLMMVNQLNGVYRIKNHDLLPMYNNIQELLKKFDAVAFVHARREFNREADYQANLAIERHFDESIATISGDEHNSKTDSANDLDRLA